VIADASTRIRLRLLATSSVLYFAALAVVLLWPVHVDGRGGLFRFEPMLHMLAWFGIPAWAGYPFVEFAANSALFLPLGVLLALVLDRRPSALRIVTAGVLGAATSVAAELAQGLLMVNRTMDPRDVLANGVGAAIGAIATVLVAHAVRRRGSRAERLADRNPESESGAQG
jgi:VanZ family protein